MGAFTMMTDEQRVQPPHPGVLLRDEFLEPLGITPHALSVALHVAASRINAIVRGERSITTDTALRLSRYFGMSPSFFVNLQARYDLMVPEDTERATIDREVQPRELPRI
jgi:addiction module HigA family antidote